MPFDIGLSNRPLIMGVVNVTPDSFSDGGLYHSPKLAVEYAKRLVEEGADILDVGGESTRPGSAPVSVGEELNRVIPVLKELVESGIPVSIDTSKPEVMQHAIEAGAAIINDVNALRSPGALETIAGNGHVIVCLMHMQGAPQYMQTNPKYENIVAEVKGFLQERIDTVKAAGVSQERLIIDPGFGFGKMLRHNLELLRCLEDFKDLDVPILAGLSRKSMLGAITGNEATNRVHESVSAALIAVTKGANIVRVHDVKATKEALAVYNAIQ